MNTNRRLSLFVTAFLVLLLAACGAPATSTPTTVPPTDVPSETPDVEMTGTETETATAIPTATVETLTPTATGQAGVIPVDLVCWFCIQQVSHVIVTLPTSATFQVLASSAVECNSVETVDDKQIVLCQGPKQLGNVSFDLNVCSNGNCSDRHLTTIDCSATAMPTETFTPTITPTLIGTVTLNATTPTATLAVGATVTSTTTPLMAATSTATLPIIIPSTPTPTP